MSISISTHTLLASAAELTKAKEKYFAQLRDAKNEADRLAPRAVPQGSVATLKERLSLAEKNALEYERRISAHIQFLQIAAKRYEEAENALVARANALPRR